MLSYFLLRRIALPRAGGQAAASPQTQAPRPWEQNPNGMHIYIWAGLKSHSAGQHDYPQFLADWSKILTEHGAVVDGALHAPFAADLEHTDVVILYKGDAPTSATKRNRRLKTMSNGAEGWSASMIHCAAPIRLISRRWLAAPRSTARSTTRSERRSPTQWWTLPTPS